jgi:L-asparaginase
MSQGVGEAGLTPEKGADDLLAAVPELALLARMVTHQVCNVGSPSVRLDDVVAGVEWARTQVDAGAVGVVFTHGTDTLEETAFLVDLLWDREAPIVVTGAMRGPEEPGADGPANLVGAVLTTLSWQARGLGALVVMNDQVFRGDRIRKAHTFAVDAFRDQWNPQIGRITEGMLEVDYLPASPRPTPLPLGDARQRVAVVGTGIGDEGEFFAAVVADGAGALVIDGVGAGHVSAQAAEVVGDLVGRVPVVMASRTRGGRAGRTTYAYPGAEVDLINRGVIMAGRLNAAQARLLAWVLLSTQADQEEWRRQYELRG